MLIFLPNFCLAKKSQAIATSFILALLSYSSSFAANVSWIDTTGNYETPSNWSTGTVPNSEIDNITINGPASNVTNSQTFITICYGSVNNCTFIVSNGAQFNANLIYSGDAGATATIDISNSSILNVAGPFLIAQSGTATLTVSNGSIVTSGISDIGTQSTATGTVIITDPGSTWLAGTQIGIGSEGNGSLTIQNGGRLVSNGPVIMASGGSSAGTLNLIGSPGNQGVLEANELRKGTGTATVNFDGGILRALTNNPSFITGFTSPLQVNSGGLFIDSNGFTIGTNNSFSGTGGITKQGSGTFILSGNNAGILGANTVAAGILTVNGLLGGTMDVQPGAQLGGTGNILGTTTVNGTISPGNPVGTLTITGNYIQAANSFYQVTINSQGQTDLINISGTASLDSSARVRVSGTALPGFLYRILTATGGVTGQYRPLAAEDANFLFFNYALSYDPNNVYLQAIRNSLSFASVALTPNQRATATAVESLGGGNAVYNAVVNLTSVQAAREAFDALSGEIHASALAVLTEESRYLREAVFNRLQQALSPNTNPLFETFNFMSTQHSPGNYALWVQGFGSWGDFEGNYNTSPVDRATKGLFMGADIPLGEEGRLGLVGGYSHSNFDANNLSSAARSDNYHIGIYGGKQVDSWDVKLGAAYTSHNINTSRSVIFPGFSSYLTAFYLGNTTQAFGELGYRFIGRNFEVEPLLGAASLWIDRDGFNEQGGAAALEGVSAAENIVYSTVGIREIAYLFSNEIAAVDERIFLGWRHAYTDINPQAIFAFGTDSVPFLISGVPIAQDALIVDAGINFKLKTAKPLSLRLSYIGQWASEVQDNGVAATFIWRFS